MSVSAVDWVVLLGIVVILFAVDLLVATLRPHAVGFREAALWSGFFIAVAIGFGFVLAALEGWGYAGQYFAGYIVEKSLSIDNLFVFVIIMTSFAVPREHQQRVLIFGIIASLCLRAAFIAVGAALLSALSFMFLIFGLVLVWTAFRLFTHRESDPDVANSGLVRVTRRFFPVTDDYDGGRLLTRQGGKRAVTPLFIVFIAIGGTDMLFALDSIPAVFGVTNEAYIVFAANAFALLGLRALYFLVTGLLDRLVYLSAGLAVILAFIGAKLILHWAHGLWHGAPEISTPLSLAVIGGVLVITTVASLIKVRRDPTARAHAGAVIGSEPRTGHARTRRQTKLRICWGLRRTCSGNLVSWVGGLPGVKRAGGLPAVNGHGADRVEAAPVRENSLLHELRGAGAVSVTGVEKRPATGGAVLNEVVLNETVLKEAGRRRTFAVISHPDAGKSTLTEALALHAAAINTAGAVHGKAGRRGVTSDWMAMERDRGISITSAVLKFDYDGHVLNLLDTPGHADFSEDTYRVLEAVDCAIMLLDSAKGLEPQTLKLFDVCRSRHVPVVTFVNKWDRPGREPLELLDEIEQRIGLRPTPVNWPVGIAGDFRGLIERATGEYTAYTRRPGGAERALEDVFNDPEKAREREGTAYDAAEEELALLTAIGAEIDLPSFLAGESSPVLFGAALPNFGVRRLLDAMCDLAPAPAPRASVEGDERAVDAPFSGLVFKVQANMDPAHRDRVAFVRVCSGRFERGMVLTHAATGRPFATKYAQAMFGQERETVETAFPGDVIGLVNATALRPGDTLYANIPVSYPPIPSFAPEHFAVVRCKDAGKFKQFRRGIDQLDTEGVVQVLSSDLRGDQAPVLAAVGPLQFDVVMHRLEHEFGAKSELSHLDYEIARLTDEAGVETLAGARGAEVLTRRLDGALLALFADKWRLNAILRDNSSLRLDPLLAGTAQ